MAKPALGKGLSALIPAKQKAPVAPIPANTVNSVLDLKIESIKPNEYQPRRIFRDEALNDLVSSIKEKGVIQPIIVRKDTGSSYELIAGERRWRASQLAGLKTIPAIVIDAVPIEALELAIIENIQREDLNPLETAEAFQRLVDEFALTHDELSKKVGKDRATVSNYLRILKLTPEVKKSIAAGTLTMGHAKALLQAPNERLQQEIAQKVIRNGLSVRETESLCKNPITAKKPGLKLPKDPQIASLEEKMIQSLGTKVRLIHKSNKKGGRIEVDYFSLEELDRLLEILIQ